MKVTIKYEKDSDTFNPFWARAYNEDGKLIDNACCESFEEARDRLISKLQLREIPLPHPPDEEIEIDG